MDSRVLFEISGDGDFEVYDFASHPAVAGVSRLVTNWGGSLQVSAPATTLVTSPSNVYRDLNDNYSYDVGEPTGPFALAAVYEQGLARFAAVSGAPFQDSAYEWRDNTPFMRALLRWLTGPR